MSIVNLEILTIDLTVDARRAIHWFNELQNTPPNQAHAAFECWECEYRGIEAVRYVDGHLYGMCPRCKRANIPENMFPVCPRCNAAADIVVELSPKAGPPATRASCKHCEWEGTAHPKWRVNDRMDQM